MKNKTTRRQFAAAGVVLAATTVCGGASPSSQQDGEGAANQTREAAPETSQRTFRFWKAPASSQRERMEKTPDRRPGSVRNDSWLQ